MKLFVSERQLVRPGDILAVLEGEEVPMDSRMRHIPDKHVYIVGNKVYSDVLGVVSVEERSVSVIPLESVYMPRKDDLVIGVVVDVGITSLIVDIKAPYKAILPASEIVEGFNPAVHNLRNYIDVGDYVLAKVAVFDRLRDPVLTIKGKGLGKIIDGFVIDIKPSKVARVIGRRGSMYNVLTSMTKCEVVIGLNGYIWARCPSEQTLKALIKAVKLIEAKAHIKGLTEEVKLLLETELGAMS